jgi:NitT/TauT family transport system ATP-binding protein
MTNREAFAVAQADLIDDGQRGPSVLSLDDVSLRYGEHGTLACRNISFDVVPGEFVAIVGPSGCGKTTLLKLVAGLLRPSSGEVTLAGVGVNSPPGDLAIVFQDYGRSLFPWLSVAGNVMFPLKRRKGLSRQEKNKRVQDAIQAVELTGFSGSYPWQLSGGMQQRVALARALSFGPRLLLLDEPFASVDALTSEALEDLVLNVRHGDGSDITTLLVTHDIDEAVYMSDRVIVLSAHPASVIEQVPVSLPRPREQMKSRTSVEFLEVRNRIHALVSRQQGDRDMAGHSPRHHTSHEPGA